MLKVKFMFWGKKSKKAISPLIAAVILISIVMAIGIFLTSSFSSIFKQKVSSTSVQEKCSAGGLQIVYTGCSNGLITVTVSNTGQASLSNFSLFANINGNIYVNNTPKNGNNILLPGDILKLEAATSNSGEISKLRVSSGGDCPGVYMEVTNETSKIGTC